MNRYVITAGALLVSVLAAGARAQEDRPPGPPDEGGVSPELNLEVIEEFDLDGDGALSDDELGRARRFMGALRRLIAERGDRPRAEGRRDRPRADRPDEARPDAPADEGVVEGDRPRGERGLRDGARQRPRADGEGPPEGRPRGQRDRSRRLFREFDADENGQLNPEEFAALMQQLERPRGPGGPPEGRRFGPGGPPDGAPFGRRLGPPPGDRAPGRRGPGGSPELDGERPGGPPEGRVRPGDGERGRRPMRPDGPRRAGPGRPTDDAPAAEEPADGDSV